MTPAEFKALRERFGITQEQAGQALQVSRVTVQNWERGSSPLPHSAELWIMRQPGFGPVLLQHWGQHKDVGHGSYRYPKPRPVQEECLPTNEDAFARALMLTRQMSESEGVFDTDFRGSILTADQEQTVYGPALLAREVDDRLRHADRDRERQEFIDRIMEIARRASSLPRNPDFRMDDLYDERGLPK